jgi:hypothetical protein
MGLNTTHKKLKESQMESRIMTTAMGNGTQLRILLLLLGILQA